MKIGILFPVILISLIFVIPILVAVYVYRDAGKRGMNAVLWMLIAFLTPSLLGFIIYLLVRNNYSDLTCPNCNTRVEESFIVCPNCRTQLRPTCSYCAAPIQTGWNACPHCGQPLSEHSGTTTSPVRAKDKTLWKILLAVLIIPIALILLIIVAFSAFKLNTSTSSYSAGFSAIPVEEYLDNCEYRWALEDLLAFRRGDNTYYVVEIYNYMSSAKPMAIYDDSSSQNTHTYLIYIPGARGYIDHTLELEDKGLFSDDYDLNLDIICDGTGEEMLFEFTYQSDRDPVDFILSCNGKQGSIRWFNFKDFILEN